MPPKTPPTRKSSTPPPAPKIPPPVAGKTRVKKTFTVGPWDGGLQGEKIVVYSVSGMGKTTLASLAKDAVIIGVDDGGRKIRNPLTGELLTVVRGVETFTDTLYTTIFSP